MAQSEGEGTQAPPEQQLIAQASSALVWSVANAAVSKLGTLAIGVALARLLGPDEFGVYAVAYVALIAVLSFNDLGVSLAIVRWPGDPRHIVPTVVTLSFASSLVLTGASFALSGPFARAMDAPEATPVLQVLSLTVLVSGLVATPAALLQREFRQRTRTVIDQAGIWVGALSSMGFALTGMGAMSLGLGRLVGVVLTGVLFLRAVPLALRPGWSRVDARRLLRFGLPLAGASVLVFFVGYADQLVTGHVLGSRALGFYVLAFNLASWPVNLFSQPLRNVAPATFSRLQSEPETMRTTLVAIVGLLASVVLPVCLVLAGAAEPIIRLVYGHVWAPASAPLLWLAALAAVRILIELVYDYIVVLGRSGSLMTLQAVWLAALVPALFLGARWGVGGVAASQLAVALVLMVPLYVRSLHHTGVPLRPLLQRLLLPTLAAVGVGAGALGLSTVLSSALLATAASLAIGGLVVAGLLYLDRQTLRTLRGLRSAETASAAVAHP
jgi:O-antigen/teichoic acid export membrane protein